MSDHIYKKIELVGSSPNGIEDAVNNAIDRAAKTIRNMGWFEVAEVRGLARLGQCNLARQEDERRNTCHAIGLRIPRRIEDAVGRYRVNIHHCRSSPVYLRGRCYDLAIWPRCRASKLDRHVPDLIIVR